jgi:integrase
MATIRKRVSTKTGKASWQIDYFDPNGKRVRQSFKKKKDAEAELGKRVSLIADNRYLDVKKDYTTTLGELIDAYSENHRDQASYKSAKVYFLSNIESHFGRDTLIAKIGYKDLETYRNQLKRTLTRGGNVREVSSVNREMSCLHHLFTKGVEWELIEVSPFSKGKSLFMKENNERTRFLAEDEINPLLDNCPVWLRHIVIFCIHTGARRKEALSLKWHQVKNGYIYFEETKTDNPRQVPIDLDLQELLDSLKPSKRANVLDLKGETLSQESNGCPYVFQDNGMPVHKERVKSAFEMACKRTNIPYGIKTAGGVTFHTRRHTFGSHLAIKGIPIKTIQELMGHKTITMTMRYAHLTEETKIEAVQVLNGLTSKRMSQIALLPILQVI